MILLPTRHFSARVKKLITKNSSFDAKIDKTLQLLQLSPRHPSLRLHKLTGEHVNEWSVSVNRSIRIIFRYIPQGILLVDIGTHDEVY